MPPKAPHEARAAINIRGLPRELFYRLKMAAAAEHKTVRELVLGLIEEKIQELEKKGLLPKRKA
jgi:hypothetical protein